ncbi:MAG TPA: hypothetical protein VL201_02660 [Patescibacteria group bacterium]|nr:hypothetical protein [Patescibacteria group bacterium]
MLKIIMLTIFSIKNSYAGPTELGLVTLGSALSIGLCIAKGIADYAPQMAITSFKTEGDVEILNQGPGVVILTGMTILNICLYTQILNNKKELFTKKNLSTSELTRKKNFGKDLFFTFLVNFALFSLIQSSVLWYKQKLNAQNMKYECLYSFLNIMGPLLTIFTKEY